MAIFAKKQFPNKCPWTIFGSSQVWKFSKNNICTVIPFCQNFRIIPKRQIAGATVSTIGTYSSWSLALWAKELYEIKSLLGVRSIDQELSCRELLDQELGDYDSGGIWSLFWSLQELKMKNFSILVGHDLLTTFLEDCNNLLSKQTFLMLFLHP